MKKFLLGIALFIGGIIGLVGWIIACTINNGGLLGLTIINILYGSDLLIAGIFFIVLLLGLVLSFFESIKS